MTRSLPSASSIESENPNTLSAAHDQPFPIGPNVTESIACFHFTALSIVACCSSRWARWALA